MMQIKAAFRAITIALVLQPPVSQPPIANHVDHVMFTGGPELHGLVQLFRDAFQLPIVFDGPKQTPPMRGTCFNFGNTCLEVVPLRPDPAGSPRVAGIGSLALQAVNFTSLVDD